MAAGKASLWVGGAVLGIVFWVTLHWWKCVNLLGTVCSLAGGSNPYLLTIVVICEPYYSTHLHMLFVLSFARLHMFLPSNAICSLLLLPPATREKIDRTFVQNNMRFICAW